MRSEPATIAAQFALYPLGVATMVPTLDVAIEQARRTGVAIDVGHAASTMRGSEEQGFAAPRAAFAVVADRGGAALAATGPMPVDTTW